METSGIVGGGIDGGRALAIAASTWSLTVDWIAVIKALIVIEEDVPAEVVVDIVDVDNEPAAPEELLVLGGTWVAIRRIEIYQVVVLKKLSTTVVNQNARREHEKKKSICRLLLCCETVDQRLSDSNARVTAGELTSSNPSA